MTSSWNEFEAKVTVLGQKTVNSLDDCDAVATALGLETLPPSHVEYVTRFGAGISTPDLLIKAPRHPEIMVTLGCQVLFFRRTLSLAPVTPKLLQLISFASPDAGFQLCWDHDALDDDGEMAICIVDHDPERISLCGSNLLEFLNDYWVRKNIEHVPTWTRSWISQAISCPIAGEA